MDFGGRGSRTFADVCKRNDAPKETFTRFQLAAISSIHRFIGFHRFIDLSDLAAGGWAGWLAGLGWAGLGGAGWLAGYFSDFHGFLRIS